MAAARYLTENPGFVSPPEGMGSLSAVTDLLGLQGVVPREPVFPRYAREARFGMYVSNGQKRETDVAKTAALLRENFFWKTHPHALFRIGTACKTTVASGEPSLDGDYVSVPKPWAFPRTVDFPYADLRLDGPSSDMVSCIMQANLQEAVLVFAEEPLEEVSVRRWERKVVGRNLCEELGAAVRKAVEEKITPRYPADQKWVYEAAIL